MHEPLTPVTKKDGCLFEDGADRGRVIVFGRDTGGAYGLMELTVAPSASSAGHGAHSHRDFEEAFLVRSGRLEFLLGHRLFTLEPGDFVRAPAGVRHGYRNASGCDVDLLVSFTPGGFEELFVKYSTAGLEPSASEGFMEEATDRFGSHFEHA